MPSLQNQPFVDIHLAERGFALHWLRPRSKAPIEDAWTDAPVATVADLRASYRPGNNVGARLGEPSRVGGYYLHVIDFDVRDASKIGEARAELLRLLPNAYELPIVASGSGGASRHFYLLTDKAFRSRKLAHSKDKFVGADGKQHWAWEIELFGTRKQVAIPPSIHPDTGREYTWEREFDFDLVDMDLGPIVAAETVEGWGLAQSSTGDPDDLLAYTRSKPVGLSEAEILETLKWLPLPDWCEDRDGWFQTGMAIHHETEGSPRGFEIWCEFSKQSPKFDLKDSERVWRSFKGAAKPVRMPTLIKAAGLARLDQEQGGDEEDDDEDLLGPASSEVDSIDAIGTEAAEPSDRDWKSRLDLNPEGLVKATLHNIELILQHDERLAGVPRLNEFTQEVVQRGVPGRKPGKTPKGVRQLDGPVWSAFDPVNGTLWNDGRDHAVRSILEAPRRQGGYGIKVSDRDLRAAIDIAARRQPFHPVREQVLRYDWDGAQRLERLFIDYLGSPDTAYTRAIARTMMVALVTRIFEPGHKFDFAVILEGLQGKRKSTFIEILALHWFAELDCDFHDPKALVEKLQGAVIVEIPELSAFSRSDVRTIKASISRRVDKVRLAYDRRAGEYPRQSIFIGSTNDKEYLRDDTGGRRFWPVECQVDEIDTDQLAKDVHQLWAEAYASYQALRAEQPHGTLPLYLTSDAAREDAERIQEDRRVETVEDAMVGQIEAWLNKPLPEDFDDEDDLIGQAPRFRTITCLLEIAIECLGHDRREYDRSQSLAQAIGKAMRRIDGWRSDGRGPHPKYGRQRVYLRNEQA